VVKYSLAVGVVVLALLAALLVSGCGGGAGPAHPGGGPPGGQTFSLGAASVSVQAVNPADLKVISYGPVLAAESLALGFWGTTIEMFAVSGEGTGRTATVPLLFVRNGDIYCNVGSWFDTWQTRRLTNTPTTEKWPVWSPRADKIAYLRGDDVWIMNADGSGQTNLTNSAEVEDQRPEWSPDGTKIAFTRVGATTRRDVWIMNPDGTGQVLVAGTTGDERDPTWMPNSRQLIYAYKPFGSVVFDLWETNLDGTVQKNLTNTPAVSEIEPMVDTKGQRLVFVRPDGGNYHIWRWDFESGDFGLGSNLLPSGPQQLTTGTGTNRNPTWEGGSDYILFNSNRDGQMELYAMEDDGRNQVNLTWFAGEDMMPYWKAFGWYHVGVGPNGSDSGFNPPLGTSRAAVVGTFGEDTGWLGMIGFSAPEGGTVTLAQVRSMGMVPLIDVTASTYLVMVEDQGRGIPRLLHVGDPAAGPRVPGRIQRAIVSTSVETGRVMAVIPFAGSLAAAQAGTAAPCQVAEEGSGLVLKGNFEGVEDAGTGRYVPGPLTQVTLHADSGRVIAYR